MGLGIDTVISSRVVIDVTFKQGRNWTTAYHDTKFDLRIIKINSF